jgi:hypothetical protein
LGFRTADGSVRHLDLVADTGSAAQIILRSDLLTALRFLPLPERPSNFGPMIGGLLRLYNPELGVVETVLGYGNDSLAATAARSHPDFAGVIGLPLLRIGEYGGNATDFWFRYPPSTPPTSPP